MPDQLLVIRHGETEWSRTGRHTGRTDLPLTDQGREEARDAARTLLDWRIDHVASSPLSRALETAELVGLAPPIVVDDDLVEWDYGDFEGERTVDTRRAIPDWSVWTHPITGGESIEEVGERVDAFLGRIADVDGNVAVFAHGHLLAVLIARWCDLAPVEGRRFALATATVSLLGHHREDRVVRALNHRCGDALHPPART
ncbi:MAG: histidine phosphatase family protein [Actinomycetota bacterium]